MRIHSIATSATTPGMRLASAMEFVCLAGSDRKSQGSVNSS
jgi:hypothetical protein